MEIMRNVMWRILLALLCAGAYSTEESIENRFLQLETRLLQLESTIDEMQSTIDEMQSTNDEMQSTIDEMQSTNDEQQSTIYELELINDELLCNYLQLPGDCQEAHELGFQDAGRHLAKLENGQLVHLLCDMDDQHQWTVIQQRKQGDVLFNRSYVEYQEGFGNVGAESDFWLGLDAMHQLTSSGVHTLRVVLTDWAGEKGYAEYGDFSVASADLEYKLHIGDYSTASDAGDSLGYNNGSGFTTLDHDVDIHGQSNCAGTMGGDGGWWFTECFWANLNGRYMSPPHHNDSHAHGLNWYHWRASLHYSYKATEMKIRHFSP